MKNLMIIMFTILTVGCASGINVAQQTTNVACNQTIASTVCTPVTILTAAVIRGISEDEVDNKNVTTESRKVNLGYDKEKYEKDLAELERVLK